MESGSSYVQNYICCPYFLNCIILLFMLIGLRTSIMNVRKEIELLEDEVDFLEHTVDDLQAEADV